MYRFPGSFLGKLPAGSRQVEEYGALIDEYGDDVNLVFVINSRKTTIKLTDMTSAELLAFENFVTATVARARPVTIARDRIVQEVYSEQGDDSFERLYRAVPELFVRAGEDPQYGQGVRNGSPNVPSVEQLGYRVSRIASAAERGLAERNASDGSTKDDGAPDDLAEDVREVGKGEEEPSF